MVTVPARTPVTRPVELTVAMRGLDDVQVTEEVTSAVVPSVYVAVAVSCTVARLRIDADDGVTLTEATWAGVTLTDDEPLIVPTAAVI
jgi:hypothetical protein